jgi:hypothetical protein
MQSRPICGQYVLPISATLCYLLPLDCELLALAQLACGVLAWQVPPEEWPLEEAVVPPGIDDEMKRTHSTVRGVTGASNVFRPPIFCLPSYLSKKQVYSRSLD